MMPHRILAVCDSLIIGIVTVCAAAASQLLSVESTTGDVAELRQLLVPLMGALIATGGMMMFQLEKEARNIVLGRAIFALLFGSGAIPFLGIFIPSMAEKFNRPVVLFLAGAAMSMFFYAVIYFIAKGVMNRSRGYADRFLDQAEKRAGMYVSPDASVRDIKVKSFIEGAEAAKTDLDKSKQP